MFDFAGSGEFRLLENFAARGVSCESKKNPERGNSEDQNLYEFVCAPPPLLRVLGSFFGDSERFVLSKISIVMLKIKIPLNVSNLQFSRKKFIVITTTFNFFPGERDGSVLNTS